MTVSCSFSECDRPARALGLCHSHYVQQRRTGFLAPLRRVKNGTPQERLEAYTQRTEACWLWTGSTRAGYGQIRVGDRVIHAHRLAYELENGTLPQHETLGHRCGNRACVRPSHLVPRSSDTKSRRAERGREGKLSGVSGVTWDVQTSRWRGKLTHRGQTIHVGRFHTIEEASEAVARRRTDLNATDRS